MRHSCILWLLLAALPAVAQQPEAAKVHRIREATEAEARQFAAQLAESVNERGGALLATGLYAGVFWDRVTRGLANPNIPEFATMDRGRAVFRQFGPQLKAQMGDHGTYRLLHVNKDGRRCWAQFRLLSEQGLNYHRVELAADPDGKTCLLDIHVALTGEPLSETLRRIVLPVALRRQKQLPRDLTPGEKALLEHLPKMLQLSQHLRAGRFAQAYDVYKSMPQALRDERPIKIMGLQATNQLMVQDLEKHGPHYAQLVEEFRKLYPDDPALPLMSIDYHLTRKNWKKMLEAIDTLDKSVGGDFYLNHYRGIIAMQTGKFAEAEAHFETVTKADPTLIDPWYSLVDAAVLSKDHAKATRRLQALEKAFGIALYDFGAAGPEFAAYMKSRDYARWLAHLRAAGYAIEPGK